VSTFTLKSPTVSIMSEHNPRDSERLISAATAALTLGVDVETLVRWHRRHRGPAARTINTKTYELAYRGSDLEAWQNRVGA
jgi:hypothetical protein